MQTGLDEARAAIKSIAVLGGQGKPVRLGGLTNLVFRVGDFCLRIPGKGTGEYINRANEALALHEAARVGVSPHVIHADPQTGILVTRFVAGATTMTPQNFKSREGAPARAGMAFRKLHSSSAVFPFRFELFAIIDDYLKILAGKDAALPPGYHEIVAEAGAIKAVLAANPAPLVPCHCDPLCENFLDTGDTMWIVDWEYCGMNDAMWDLGDLSVEGGFDANQDEELLNAYFGRQITASDRGRMVIYKAMCDLLWTLWGLIQLANNNPAEDFRAYADGRFSRCKALMRQPEFAACLQAIGPAPAQAGPHHG